MNPIIQMLASKVGVKVENRSCSLGWLFDGKSIANHYYRVNRQGIPSSLEKDRINLTDHDLLHEICHFLVASPEQRDLPEYGLGWVHLPQGDLDGYESVVDDAAIQETKTQLLCVYLGAKYNLDPEITGSSVWRGRESWSAYFEEKVLEQEERDFPRFENHFEEVLDLIQKYNL